VKTPAPHGSGFSDPNEHFDGLPTAQPRRSHNPAAFIVLVVLHISEATSTNDSEQVAQSTAAPNFMLGIRQHIMQRMATGSVRS
jgi:hypothetical protein